MLHHPEATMAAPLVFTRLLIPRSIHGAMIEHARAEAPLECCGLLAGRVACDSGNVTHHYPLPNELRSATEFLSEPVAMFRAVKDMRANGIDVLAVYHSHPASPPVPSRRDRERNYSADVVNLIIGLAGEAIEIRGWWLTENDSTEALWEIVDC